MWYKKNIFLLIWSLELINPYHKLLHNWHVSSWRPHHPDFEIFDGSRLTQPLTYKERRDTVPNLTPLMQEYLRVRQWPDSRLYTGPLLEVFRCRVYLQFCPGALSIIQLWQLSSYSCRSGYGKCVHMIMYPNTLYLTGTRCIRHSSECNPHTPI